LSSNELIQYLELADGVLITGADSNVNPIYYGEAPLKLEKMTRVDDERDRTDLALIRLAYEKKLPMLGICKGMQIINVALGGTLYQDVNAQHPYSSNHDIPKTNRANFTHLVTTTKGSLSEEIFGKGEVRVNGGHQQAVKELAPGLKQAASSSDGIVEIYEGEDYPFLVGTQFHPELRPSDSIFFGLLERFIQASMNK
jgi:putative glutamine amidotransferase